MRSLVYHIEEMNGMAREEVTFERRNWLGECIRGFTDQQVQSFFFFTTSLRSFPSQGINIKVIPEDHGDEYLPRSQTCERTLYLPKYTNQASLCQKLAQAIAMPQEFGNE